jgi:aryl-alcohol dehydrogenase-like predicted oxidoreductase
MGTYLGNPDDATDSAVIAAGAAALAGGVNVLDTAINYRCQRAERSLGRLLSGLIGGGKLSRAEVFVSTKAGYVPNDGSVPADKMGYIRETYLKTGVIATPGDLVGRIQCVSPGYLTDQLRRSRENLGLACIDLFYLHNPEYMIPVLGRNEWRRRMEAAFKTLEDACQQGLIGGYGTATWDGYRVGPERPDHLELSELLELARLSGGAGHHFTAIQLPISLAAPEAVRDATQTVAGKRATVLEAAAELGVAVFASAPLLQGQALSAVAGSPAASLPGLSTDAQRALQSVRSLAGVACVLIGMKGTAHVRENLALAAVPPAPLA